MQEKAENGKALKEIEQTQHYQYIDTNEPWTLAKDEKNTTALGEVLYQLLEGLRTVAGLISPVMPETSGKIIAALGLELPEKGFFLVILSSHTC